MVKGLCLWSFYVWRPCKDHAGTKFGLALLPGQLELGIFQIESRIAKAYVYEVSTLHVMAMF